MTEQIQSFQVNLNKKLSSLLETKITVDFRNCEKSLEDLEKVMISKLLKKLFLAESVIFSEVGLENQMFLYENIGRITSKKIISTKLLFMAHSKMHSWTEWR